MLQVWDEERYIEGFGGETWGKEPLRRPRREWDNNIKMEFHEVGVGHVLNWSGSGEGQWRGLVNAIMDLRVP